MKINKVLLIQQVEENKVRYILELADMPRFVINCGSYYPVEAVHYAASIDIIDERVVGQCFFNVCDVTGHIRDYEHGCKSVDDVIDSSDGCGWLFSAYSTYDNYHIDYQAIRADHIQPIKR